MECYAFDSQSPHAEHTRKMAQTRELEELSVIFNRFGLLIRELSARRNTIARSSRLIFIFFCARTQPHVSLGEVFVDGTIEFGANEECNATSTSSHTYATVVGVVLKIEGALLLKRAK